MNHSDHVALLRGGVPPAGTGEEGKPPVWADLGSGEGAFTLTLADLLGPAAAIYTIDKDRGSLREQERQMAARFPLVTAHYTLADFTRPLDLPPLDGIVMANSLHYVRDKEPLLRRLLGYLRPAGRLILVEYNADTGNPWVPYPLSYPTWDTLSRKVGFAQTRMLASVPSRFLREMYSALSLRGEA